MHAWRAEKGRMTEKFGACFGKISKAFDDLSLWLMLGIETWVKLDLSLWLMLGIETWVKLDLSLWLMLGIETWVKLRAVFISLMF
ncbi:unnamed protein product [Brassica napus]|uniref:(rape) hypothetical protein n=1 Tax=Brassica napus TaxID=3708 RepID=A0A816IK40_BRANA|nr:unnamed protein product [Brassica napus]